MAGSGKAKTLMCLFLVWIIYLIIGMFIFRAVERDHKKDKPQEETKQQSLDVIRENVTAKYNMSEAEFDFIVQQIEAASSTSSVGRPEWSYTESLSFVVQLVTTVGYGNITPVTTGGRVLCIIFALIGIPINIIFLQLLGERMLRSEHFLVMKFEQGCLKREGAPKFLNEKCSFVGFLLLLIILFAGAGCQMEMENWTFFEGFYAYFITFTTVGFGDLIPGSMIRGSPNAKITVSILFIIMGLAAMSNVINGLVN
ncbi:potassium channel subfamily K member 9-like [Stylophora pistillata]|uniref:potassium channel subfamily K member 9-like n=1 Tax=Stylophora pistillata TaxID=50429 RepID=UPI000C03CEA9|nr:potassium channel subfamily K member 9-like [Stylophora pistillata]